MANSYETDKGTVYIYNDPYLKNEAGCKCGGNCGCKTGDKKECACGGNCNCK